MTDNKDKSGSIIVDAACCMPVFVIAMSLILILIAKCGVEETVFNYMCRAADSAILAVASSNDNSTNDKSIPSKAAVYSAYNLELRTGIHDEWSSNTNNVHLAHLECDIEADISSGTHIDRMIRADVEFETRIPIIGSFVNSLSAHRCLLFRPWLGESSPADDYDDTTVYIFPKRGEHYHNIKCSCLKSGEIQTILNKTIRKHYKACTSCHPEKLSDGSPVFLMTSKSNMYHRKTCPCITKAFEAITLSDAVSMGYSPCGLCGGILENYKPENDPYQ